LVGIVGHVASDCSAQAFQSQAPNAYTNKALAVMYSAFKELYPTIERDVRERFLGFSGKWLTEQCLISFNNNNKREHVHAVFKQAVVLYEQEQLVASDGS